MLTEFPWDLDMLPFVAFEDQDDLPLIPAIYIVRAEEQSLYIGGTVDLYKRFHPHQYQDKFEAHLANVIAWMPLAVSKTARGTIVTLEAQAVDYYKPLLNQRQPHRARVHSFRQEEYIPRTLKNRPLSPQVHEYTVAVFMEERVGHKPFFHAYVRVYDPAWKDICLHTVTALNSDEAKRQAIQECKQHKGYKKPPKKSRAILENRLASLRVAQDISQIELGNQLGISTTILSRWENGKSNIPLRYLPVLASALQTSPAMIVPLLGDIHLRATGDAS